MNAILACLEQHRSSLADKKYGVSPDSRYIVKTPQFRASRHVVLMYLPVGADHPTLVVKVPRLPDDRWGIDREAAALEEIASRAGEVTATTIPRLVGVWDCCGHPALVQTALVGRPIDPATIHRDRDQCCHDVTEWLIRFHDATTTPVDDRAEWYNAQVNLPLSILESTLGDSDEDRRLLERARQCAGALRDLSLPAVIEHGDFGHPNLFRLGSGEIGVIDWELADPRGIPVADLWFFLSYAATVRVHPESIDEQLDAFRAAFHGSSCWTNPYLERYLRALEIPRQAVESLFVLSWTRYLAKLAGRLGTSDSESPTNLQNDSGRTQLANWLRNSRYYAFWRQAVLWTE